MKYILPITLALTGCVGQAKQTHLAVADAVSQSLNVVAPTIVEQYKVDLRSCRVTATHILEYKVCAAQVDERYAHLRDVWSHARRIQDEYAKALETKEPSLPDFAEWVQNAYCQLKAVAPETLKIPEVPGLVCKDD